MGTPAATETTSWSARTSPPTSVSTLSMTCGLTERTTTSRLAQRGVVVRRRRGCRAAWWSCSEPLGLHVAREDALGRQHLAVQEPLDERPGHVAGAEKSESLRLHSSCPRHAGQRVGQPSLHDLARLAGRPRRGPPRIAPTARRSAAPPEARVLSTSAAAHATPSTARRSSPSSCRVAPRERDRRPCPTGASASSRQRRGSITVPAERGELHAEARASRSERTYRTPSTPRAPPCAPPSTRSWRLAGARSTSSSAEPELPRDDADDLLLARVDAVGRGREPRAAHDGARDGAVDLAVDVERLRRRWAARRAGRPASPLGQAERGDERRDRPAAPRRRAVRRPRGRRAACARRASRSASRARRPCRSACSRRGCGARARRSRASPSRGRPPSSAPTPAARPAPGRAPSRRTRRRSRRGHPRVCGWPCDGAVVGGRAALEERLERVAIVSGGAHDEESVFGECAAQPRERAGDVGRG